MTDTVSTGLPTSQIGLISGDSHVNEPRDLWTANLPRALREQGMRGIQSHDDGGWSLMFEGSHSFTQGMEEDERLEATDPVKRLEVMRHEGIVAECVFPTIGLYVWMLPDADAGMLSCRIYNDWILQQLHVHSPRYCCAGLVPTWRPDQAVAEIEHIAEIGLGALMFPAIVDPFWNHKQWAPVWDAAAATGLPIVMHQGTGHDMLWYRGAGATVANAIATQSMAPRVATMLATSGILAAHPDLHVVFVEYNTGWLAWTMETADQYDTAFRTYDETVFKGIKKTVYPDLPMKPSDYIRRQVHATFQVDNVGIGNIGHTGAECLMWGSDYPHEEGTYPHSREAVDRQSASMSEADARKVFRENALSVFGFDRAEIGPLT